MMRVPLTLISASATGFEASLKSDADELGDELGLPAEDATGSDADVAAVVTKRDARNQRLDIGLAEVGVSTGCASLSTVEARVDTGNQRADLQPECAWVRLQQLLSVRHDPSLLHRFSRAAGRPDRSGPERRSDGLPDTGEQARVRRGIASVVLTQPGNQRAFLGVDADE